MKTRRNTLEAHPPRNSRGFTLIEAVMVIVITGIIAAVVAVFMRGPVEGYFDAVRRAGLTDDADLALRRIGRDLRTALPNSVRVTTSGGNQYLEYLETSYGGRYRAAPTDAGAGDALDFAAADTSFDVIGTPPAAAGGDIVVANLGEGSPADAYAGSNRTAFTGLAGNTVSMTSIAFPVESPGRRFHVVSQPVTYECNTGAGELRRYTGYTIAATQPTAFIVTPALLATRVSGCTITYDVVMASTGVVSIRLELTSGGESVSLFHQAHVANIP